MSTIRKKTSLKYTLLLGPSLALSVFTSVAQSGDLDEALSAYRQEDYRKAAELLSPLARAGEPKAQLTLGNLYYAGLGVNQDHYRALELYRSAASTGLAEAQFQLGLMYLSDEVINVDEYAAMEWLGRAATQGHVQADVVYGQVLNSDFGIGC